jgi:hypothetical protein
MSRKALVSCSMAVVLALYLGCGSDEDGSAPAAAPIAPLGVAGTHYGHTYGEWGAEWWKWFYRAPGSKHPVVDATGEFCNVAQDASGPVFFLAGNQGGTTARTCTVPAAKALLVPIVNFTADNGGVPAAEQVSDDALQEYCTDFMANVVPESLYARLDGRSLGDITRQIAPLTRYSYDVPATDNIYELYGLDVQGTIDPSFSTGYYVLLPPLPPGKHEVEFGGRAKGTPQDFVLDITYHLVVE